MKRFKKGFTLAEVLLSLTIVGVLAAMTVPSLMVNVQKQQVGPALAKAINSLESANRLMLSDKGLRRLDELNNGVGIAAYLNDISSYLSLRRDSSTIRPFYKFDLTTSHGFALVTYWFTDKNGISYGNKLGCATNNNDNMPNVYSGKYYTVYIDTNGSSKKPNAIGHDIFQVLVDVSGQVIPFGSRAYADYMGVSETWVTKCASNKKAVPVDANYCAGAIVDNGFRVLY